MSIQFAPAKEEDLPFLAEVIRGAASFYDPILPGAFKKQAQRFLQKGLPDIYRVHVIKNEDHPIGFVGGRLLTPQTLYMAALYLLPLYQRKGFGRKILDALESEVRQMQVEKIVLLAHEKAYWAKNFYLQNGFRVIETDPDKMKAYGGGDMTRFVLPNTLMMEKRL